MGGIEDGNPGSIGGDLVQGPASRGDSEEQRSEDVLSDLEVQAHKLLDLSSEMTHILSDFSRKAELASDQLQALRAELNQKRQDLKALCQIELSAVSLERLAAEHRVQEENLERLIENQQTVWEEEKDRLSREERAYLENLNAMRRLEEEGYQRRLQNEELAARQKIEEELQMLRQKETDRQAMLDKELLQREQILQSKEQAAAKLIQELEQFIAKLARRDKSQGMVSKGLKVNTNSSATDSVVPNHHFPDNTPMSPVVAPSLTSVNEMLLSLNRKNEVLREEVLAKKESALLKCSFKKPESESEENENRKQ